MLRNGQKAGSLSLKVKRDERVGCLVVGWGGCECDGLVSNTLSLSMSATPTFSPKSYASKLGLMKELQTFLLLFTMFLWG